MAFIFIHSVVDQKKSNLSGALFGGEKGQQIFGVKPMSHGAFRTVSYRRIRRFAVCRSSTICDKKT